MLARRRFLAAVAALAAASTARGQSFPSRTIRIVVPTIIRRNLPFNTVNNFTWAFLG